MNSLIAAAVQMNSGDDIAANHRQAVTLIERAVAQGARLVVLPEVFPFMGSQDAMRETAESIPGRTSTLLQETARRLQIHLVGGSFFERHPATQKVFNTSLFLGPDGSILGQYRKIHLFEIEATGELVRNEAEVVEPGTEVVAVETPFGVVGMSVCYDIRFPELYRALASRNARIIVLPAAFALKTGKDHWETLIRARAIENQAFVIASGQVGIKPDGYPSYGRSMIVDPWGTVIAQASDTETVITAELDFAYLETVRRALPALKNRRL